MIERKTYLEMCRKCATLPSGVFGIKKTVPKNLRVVCDGIEYYPVGYKLEFDDKGNCVHSVVLHDLTANAVVSASLAKITKLEEQ